MTNENVICAWLNSNAATDVDATKTIETESNICADLSICSVLESVDNVHTTIDDVNIDEAELATSISSISSDSLTSINSNVLNVDTNNYNYGIASIGTYANNWVTIDDSIVTTNKTMERQISVLENQLKFFFFSNNRDTYDRELTQQEFEDLVSIYVTNETKKECKATFNKDIALDEIHINFVGDSTSFSLDNSKDLLPDIFLYYNSTFYINSTKLLTLIKKAAFNRLLNVN